VASAGAGVAAGAVSGRGFDAKHILLGYTISSDANRGIGALGFDVGVGDTDAQVKAIVADLNRHGGILGRHIDLVVHDFSFANYTRQPEQETQKACATFTEDHKVFAVLNTIGLGTSALAQCLNKFDIPYLDNRFGLSRDPAFSKYSRTLYKPSSMNVDTYVPLFIGGLQRQKYFTGWDTVTGAPGPAPVKIGMLHFDTPEWDYYMNGVKKQLAAIGYKVDKEVTFAEGVDNVVAASSSAVLSFRDAGITHVINASIAFLEAAENQQYRPRYSIDEGVGPSGMAQIAPAKQLHGSLGAGYNPYNDVLVDGKDPQSTSRPVQLACAKVMRDAGQDPSAQTVLQMMLSECDLFNFLNRGLAAAGAIGTDALATGANSLASTFPTAVTFETHFDARHHAGASAARSFAYVDDCSCYRYTSPSVHDP
jgi:hypothetical protein